MSETVAVVLPSDIVYVYGTVNGETASWQLTDGMWRAVAPRSSNGAYVIELAAYDEAGNFTEYRVTLNYGLNLITDRTQADVNYVTRQNARIEDNLRNGRSAFYGFTEAERSAWLAGLKGAYNASDLNRVGEAMLYLRELLRVAGYPVNVAPETGWVAEAIPVHSQMEYYRRCVEAMRAAIILSAPVPETPESMNALTYEKANDIEKILLAVDTGFYNIRRGYVYSGEIYSSEDFI